VNAANHPIDPLADPVDPRQRQQARVLGLILGGGFLALVVTCIIIFKANGLPKDPKEWKRLQEQRSALGTGSAEPQKDQTR
jgi:hypothetical protein